MSYECKYRKYKNKFLNLKNKIIGGVSRIFSPEQISFETNEITINRNIFYDTSRNGYNIIINDDKENNIVIKYLCEILTINIFIDNISKKVNGEILTINIENTRNIRKINFNGYEFNDIVINSKIIEYMLKFNTEKINKNNIFDVCIAHIDNVDKSKPENNIEKFVGILICNKLRSMFGNLDVSNYFYLLLFIYEIMFISEIKLENNTYDEYSKKLFKISLPIYLPNNIIKIQNADGTFGNLFNKFNFLLDTGNSGYTNISERFFGVIRNGKDTVCKKANSSSHCMNGKCIFNYIVKFKIEFYNKKFLIFANINSKLNLCNKDTIIPENNDIHIIDILFGTKSGINLLFKNNFVIDSEGNQYSDIAKTAHKNYIDSMNNLLIETCEKIKNNARIINDEIINFFIIKFMNIIVEHNNTINDKLKVNLNIDEITKKYRKTFIYSVSVIEILDDFKETYNLTYPKEVNFYDILSEEEYILFIEKRFSALSCTQEIIDGVTNTKIDISKKFSSFIELLSKLMF